LINSIFYLLFLFVFFFFQAEDGIRDRTVTGVQTCALPIYSCLRKNVEMCSFRSAMIHQLKSGVEIGTNPDCVSSQAPLSPARLRSEERRVGKECRSRVGAAA